MPLVRMRLARLMELDDGETRVARQRERDLLAGGEGRGLLGGRGDPAGTKERCIGAQDEVLRASARGDRPV